MQTREWIGFVVIPLMLLAAAWVIRIAALWSGVSNLTIPWLCSALAVSLLIIGAACALLHVSAGEIPPPAAIVVFAAVMGIAAVGVIIDWATYSQSTGLLEAGAEWVGLGVILGGALYLPRLSASTTREVRCRKCDHVLRGLTEPRCPECGEAI